MNIEEFSELEQQSWWKIINFVKYKNERDLKKVLESQHKRKFTLTEINNPNLIIYPLVTSLTKFKDYFVSNWFCDKFEWTLWLIDIELLILKGNILSYKFDVAKFTYIEISQMLNDYISEVVQMDDKLVIMSGRWINFW